MQWQHFSICKSELSSYQLDSIFNISTKIDIQLLSVLSWYLQCDDWPSQAAVLRLQTAIRKCLFLLSQHRMGWLVQGYLDLTLRSFFAYIISTLSPLSVAWIWRWSSKFFLLWDSSDNDSGTVEEIIFQERKLFWSHRENWTNDQDETGRGGRGGGGRSVILTS